ncbi:enoyl-CoA hydratase/isomerase family protein [Gemmobacter sp.]|uniref:enoyl-CoA hydratase/isomerase family protein n=1 Tax=Gemmobacter sp. TaxID=1898957 RepID=UPI002AFFFDC3|nr:enoyl-CoA hydratase-related protein [Gemmobacter sp.]
MSTTPADLVLTEFDPATGIGRLTLNRPEVLNALDAATARAFLAAVRQLTATPGLRVIVLTGAGRAFAAGGDVASFTANGIEQAPFVINDLLDALNPAILALRQHPAPVITAVRGAAAGAGLALAIAGDLVVAEERARFVIAYDKIGAPPDCGLGWFLPRRVGRGMAMDMMLTGRSLTAPEALACRLVDRVEPEAGFAAAVTDLATRIANGPTLAYGHYKRLMDTDTDLATHLEAERQSFASTTHTADFAEGVAAFIAKRPAVFRGH